MEYSISNKRWLTDEEISSEDFVYDTSFAAGLHASGSFDKILNINECHLQREESYQILEFVKKYCIEHEIKPFIIFEKKGFLHHVIIRTSYHTADFMVNLVNFKDKLHIIKKIADALLENHSFIKTIVNNVNDRNTPTTVGRYEKVVYGPEYIRDNIDQYKFNIHPNAFCQTNTAQAKTPYKVILEYANLKKGDKVYDLYCGVGTLSLFMSKKASNVLGIE